MIIWFYYNIIQSCAVTQSINVTLYRRPTREAVIYLWCMCTHVNCSTKYQLFH